jgi:hypothetical protein
MFDVESHSTGWSLEQAGNTSQGLRSSRRLSGREKAGRRIWMVKERGHGIVSIALPVLLVRMTSVTPKTKIEINYGR